MDMTLDSVILTKVKIFYPNAEKDDGVKFREIKVRGLYQGDGYLEATHKALGTVADPLTKTSIVDVFVNGVEKDPVMIGFTCALRKHALGEFYLTIPIKVPLNDLNMKIIIEHVLDFTHLIKKSNEWLERERREKEQSERMARAMLGT